MSKKRRKRVVCPNCNEQLKDQMNYCFSCGQENHIKRVSLKMLFHDFFATFFTFESKFFKTLKLLILKPSLLTASYLNGEIEKHLRPMRLYFFVSFTFFLLFGLNLNLGENGIINFNSNGEEITNNGLQKELVEDEKAGKIKQIDFSFDKIDVYFTNKLKMIENEKGETKAFKKSILSKFPIFIFFLIPVLASLLFLGFYKKKYFYVDHFVFALHLQSFLFVLLIPSTIIEIIFNKSFHFVAILGVLIYGFIAARKFYNLKRFTTFIRLSLIGLFHLMISASIGFAFFLLVTRFYTI